MTYEERQKHRELLDRSASLREALEGADDGQVTRAQARELLGIVEETLEQLSPERWDRVMETILDEASRRMGSIALIK